MGNDTVPPGHTKLDKVATSIANAIKEKMGVDFVPELKEGFQRFPAPGKSATNTSGWMYIAGDFSRATFGSFATGEKYHWFANDFEKLPAEDAAEVHERIALAREKNLENRQQAQSDAAQTAKAHIESSNPATASHQYLTSKRVGPHDLYQHDQKLLIPLYDQTGELRNVQSIYPDGSKYFLKGGQVKGAYAKIGEPFSTDTTYVCEGWATAATIYEETGHPAIAAMTAGNLLDVCIAISSKAPPGVKIVVAADNDHCTKGNPGLTKGIQAANAIGAKYVTPPLPCNYKNCRCTDFNDFSNCCNRLLGSES